MVESRWFRAGLWLAAVLLFTPLAIPMLQRRMFVTGDLSWFHIPVRHLYSEALAHGDSILWTPAFFRGFFMHGEGQLGALHPLHLVLYSTLPLPAAFGVEFLLIYAAATVGMRLFLHRLAVSGAAAWFGGLLFAFSGYNLNNLQHMNVVAVAAHLPWIALGAHDLMIGVPRRRTAAFVTVALATGSALLFGYPQALALGLLFATPFAILAARHARAWRRLPAVLVALAAGAAIGAAQVLPTLHYVASSDRAAGSLAFIESFSLHPWNLLQLLAPFAWRQRVYAVTGELQIHEFALYDGAFCTLAICWLAARARAIGRRATVSLAAAGVALILALGRYGGVHLLIAGLPVFNRFRGPARFLELMHFALAIVGALVFDDIRTMASASGARRIPRRALALAVIGAAIAAVTVLAVFGHAPDPERVASAPRVAFGFFLIGGCATLVVAAANGQRWAQLVLPVFVALDLGWWGYRAVMTRPMTTEELERTIISQIPPEAGPGSVLFSIPDASVNVVTLADRRLSWAYVGIFPGRVVPFGDRIAQRLSGVDWVRDERGWFRAPWSPMPTVRLVTDVRRRRANLLQDLREVDLSRTAFVDEDLPPLSGSPGTARLLELRPGRIVVAVDGGGPSLLVTTETFDDDWHAFDGATPLRAVRVDGDYLGVPLPAGPRTVTFRFSSRSTRQGIRVSVAGLLFTGIGAFVLRRRG